MESINSIPKHLRPSILVSATALGFYGKQILNTVASVELKNEYSIRRPFIFSGTSEKKTFDESSPSGNDYLAKVASVVKYYPLFVFL